MQPKGTARDGEDRSQFIRDANDKAAIDRQKADALRRLIAENPPGDPATAEALSRIEQLEAMAEANELAAKAMGEL